MSSTSSSSLLLISNIIEHERQQRASINVDESFDRSQRWECSICSENLRNKIIKPYSRLAVTSKRRGDKNLKTHILLHRFHIMKKEIIREAITTEERCLRRRMEEQEERAWSLNIAHSGISENFLLRHQELMKAEETERNRISLLKFEEKKEELDQETKEQIAFDIISEAQIRVIYEEQESRIRTLIVHECLSSFFSYKFYGSPAEAKPFQVILHSQLSADNFYFRFIDHQLFNTLKQQFDQRFREHCSLVTEDTDRLLDAQNLPPEEALLPRGINRYNIQALLSDIDMESESSYLPVHQRTDYYSSAAPLSSPKSATSLAAISALLPTNLNPEQHEKQMKDIRRREMMEFASAKMKLKKKIDRIVFAETSERNLIELVEEERRTRALESFQTGLRQLWMFASEDQLDQQEEREERLFYLQQQQQHQLVQKQQSSSNHLQYHSPDESTTSRRTSFAVVVAVGEGTTTSSSHQTFSEERRRRRKSSIFLNKLHPRIRAAIIQLQSDETCQRQNLIDAECLLIKTKFVVKFEKMFDRKVPDTPEKKKKQLSDQQQQQEEEENNDIAPNQESTRHLMNTRRLSSRASSGNANNSGRQSPVSILDFDDNNEQEETKKHHDDNDNRAKNHHHRTTTTTTTMMLTDEERMIAIYGNPFEKEEDHVMNLIRKVEERKRELKEKLSTNRFTRRGVYFHQQHRHRHQQRNKSIFSSSGSIGNASNSLNGSFSSVDLLHDNRNDDDQGFGSLLSALKRAPTRPTSAVSNNSSSLLAKAPPKNGAGSNSNNQYVRRNWKSDMRKEMTTK